MRKVERFLLEDAEENNSACELRAIMAEAYREQDGRRLDRLELAIQHTLVMVGYGVEESREVADRIKMRGVDLGIEHNDLEQAREG